MILIMQKKDRMLPSEPTDLVWDVKRGIVKQVSYCYSQA